MSKIKTGGLDRYGAGPFEQQQFGTAGIEGVNKTRDGKGDEKCQQVIRDHNLTIEL